MTDHGKKAGRPPHQSSDSERRQVESMTGYGIPLDDVARVLKISVPTLFKYYRHEIETGHIKANSMVAQSLFAKATGNGPGSVIAAIFWLKVRAGWREVERDDITPPLGKKQMQEAAALTAGHGSDWADDLDYAGDGGKPN